MNSYFKVFCKYCKLFTLIQTQCKQFSQKASRPKKIKTAVLMVYTGGPKCKEEVACFAKRVILDKNLSYGPYNKAERLEQAEKAIPHLEKKYETIGNKTPQFELIRMQAKLVQERLDLMCLETSPHKTIIGCQFVKPNVADALKEIAGIKTLQNVLVLPMYPQYSCGLTGGCFNSIYKYYKANPLPDGVKWTLVDSWSTTFSLIKNTAYFIKKELVSCNLKKEPYTLIFGGRPMPMQANLFGDFYSYLVGASVLHVMKQLHASIPYAIGWHAPPADWKWFQPSVETVLKNYVHQGKKWFMLAPISTVVENMVTFHDYDIHLQQNVLPELGKDIKLKRISAPNTSSYFINAVVDVCKEALTSCTKIPFNLSERCVLCENAECVKYKNWCKDLLSKHGMKPSPKKKLR